MHNSNLLIKLLGNGGFLYNLRTILYNKCIVTIIVRIMRDNGQKFITARKLRSAGWSYGEIGARLKVSKSTLSGWLRGVKLSEKQRLRLKKRWEDGLKLARERAADAHRRKTRQKFEIAIVNARGVIKDLNGVLYKKSFLKLFLAALYLGEGAKNKSVVCLANSNPDICKAFVVLLRTAYELDEARFRCHLHLRADQNAEMLSKFWSELLQIPAEKFHRPQIDKRTSGKPSRDNYRGVCAIYYYNANIQKDILSLGKITLEKLLNMGD